MTSRSYYALAGSSFLLLMLACPSSSTHRADRRVDPSIVAGPEKRDDKKAGAKKDDDWGPDEDETAGMAEPGAPAAADDGGETGEEPFGHKESLDRPPTSKPRADGCKKGRMKFEGKCRSKERVAKVLENRGEEIKRKLRNASTAQQQADAAHDLLEQQIAQMEVTEDNLDEIIRQLEQENAKRFDGPPNKNEDKP